VSEHLYPQGTIIADYGRGGAGLCVTAGPLLVVPVTMIAAIILGSMAALFAIFLIRTAAHHFMAARLDEDKITARSWSIKTINWRDLTHLQLRYFAVKKDRSQGWMQLVLKDHLTTLRFDSTLSGFDEITKAAYGAAQRNDLVLSPPTMENLGVRGIIKSFPSNPDLVV
jgi:hypothetical protein